MIDPKGHRIWYWGTLVWDWFWVQKVRGQGQTPLESSKCLFISTASPHFNNIHQMARQYVTDYDYDPIYLFTDLLNYLLTCWTPLWVGLGLDNLSDGMSGRQMIFQFLTETES